MSTYFPKSLKNKAKGTLPLIRQSPFPSRLRPAKSLYDNANVHPVLQRGYPVFDTIFDTLNLKASGLRKYKQREERPVVKTDYDASNIHEMNHRFRFKLTGTCNGKAFESELESHCNQLCLVGWIKCRRSFAVGHLQGNVIATSYMKRWMEICGSKNARFNNAVFFDENYAIPKLDYNELTVVRDYRKPQKKAQHRRAIEEKRQMQGLLT